MTTEVLEAELMALKDVAPKDRPIGPLMVKNLLRLGHADIVVRAAELARLVEKRTGKGMTRQRISAVMNAVRVEPETIELIAKGIGVKPSELLRDDPVTIA